MAILPYVCLCLALLPLTVHSQTGKSKEVLLIGTFHYNNPGLDVVKTKSFDILSEASQKELQMMAEKIKAYQPDKIFVEWPYDRQEKLDSLYQVFKGGDYYQNEGLSDYYRKGEIFQLAFRVAALADLDRVHAIDYRDAEFPFDSMMTVIATHNQKELMGDIQTAIQQITTEFDDKIESGISLLELTYYLNLPEMRAMSNTFHTEVPLLAGAPDNFIGPYLSAEWIRRNLYTWSMIQKYTAASDERIMILMGSSHIALIKDFIDQHKGWQSVELQEVMK